MSCLDNVIGLSQRDCNCLPAKPADFATKNASYSGYYVDNTEWSYPLNDDIFDDCSSSGIWDMLETARDEAVIDLNAHLLQQIGNYQTPRFGNIKDTIGKKEKYTTNLNSVSRDFLGLKIQPFNPRGTILTIRSVGLAIAEAGTYTIKLVEEDGTLISSQAVTGGSNTVTSVSVTWRHRFLTNEPIYLVYERAGGYPTNSQLYCPSCTGSRPAYTQQLSVQGIQSTSLTTLVDSTTSVNSYGLYVDFTYQCDYLDWLCDMFSDFWTTTPFGTLYAKVLQLYGSAKFNNKIIKSNKVNYYTLVEATDLIAKNQEIQEIVNELVPELASRLPDDFVDCFTCKSRHNMEVRTLII